MNTSYWRGLLLVLLSLSGTTVAWAGAGYPLEIIELEGRPATEVIPLIRPFLIPDGTLSGMDDRLIVRTSKENLQQIRKILRHIDHPPRRLLISVRQGTAAGGAGAATGADPGQPGTVGGKRSSPEAGDQRRGLSATTRSALDVTQRIQTLEGQPAFISSGRSLPVTDDQFVAGAPFPAYGSHTRYRDLATGFYALPRLNGDRVTIAISPQMQRTGSSDDRFAFQRVGSIVSGRLGEWIPLAGSGHSGSDDSAGSAGHYTTRDRSSNAIYLKVEELH